MRIAIYCRVSTDEQAAEGYSLASQVERLQDYCKAREWAIAGVYSDGGYSGRNTRRPEYTRMMDERDTWDGLLVLKMDRIHRNTKNFIIMMENLQAWHKEFISMTEALDTSSAMGRFVAQMIQSIAQLESEVIGERVHAGMSQKAKEGAGRLGFPVPLGYSKDGDQLVIVDAEAEIIQFIFKCFLLNVSISGITKGLNERGMKTKAGSTFDRKAVGYILSNPIYAGYLHWEDHVYKGEHPAIITVKQFNKAQRRKAARSRKAGHKPLLLSPDN
jgi:DNA invertase Pin-like site-specific DNA recombinase